MRTRADVKREVERMLADNSIRKPRILRFFRDYFDYDLGGYICKDAQALASTGVSTRGTAHYRAMFDGTASTDRLIELILKDCQQRPQIEVANCNALLINVLGWSFRHQENRSIL